MRHLLDDAWLKPYERTIRARAARAEARARTLAVGSRSLADFASAHEYYGLHRVRDGWVFREWAPNATAMGLVGDFTSWRALDAFALARRPGTDVWEGRFPAAAIHPGANYLLDVRWPGGGGLRIPAYARYVVQDAETALFCAQVPSAKRAYVWRYGGGPAAPDAAHPPRIYEAHIGMATEEEKVGSYAEFRRDLLPRIKAAGYDTVQLMAVMEHPYYGSFGYHVSNFFAASSRFGSPDDLKQLIDTAHGLGLRVIMDLVHSHAVKNERDGLNRFDGSEHQYFHAGVRGHHRVWDSCCFDYGRPEVLHFLLSNCRFWLDEYRFDGFRFDGVTSMLFHDHGLGDAFTDYSTYFDGSVDEDAWVYLQLANRVIHAVKPSAITIAEDVSGLPGCAAPVADCGLGFDYRMAMGEPDFWFRLAAETRDEDWPMGGMYHELTNRRAEERVVSYVESHDQALVGGKTFFFQLVDRAIYDGMRRDQSSPEIDRGLALHKMARLATLALNGGAYLNFMGNEFGHPEWIDFPRPENGWSYRHARRLWSVGDDPNLKFRGLRDFDAAMLAACAPTGMRPGYGTEPICLVADEGDKVLAFVRGPRLFIFNFHPVKSYVDYGVLVPPGTVWRRLLDTDELRFGGQGRISGEQVFHPRLVPARGELVTQIRVYLPARTALVLEL